LQCLPYAAHDTVAENAEATAEKTVFFAIPFHMLVDQEFD
jgi:hypothetical protein